MSRTYLPPAVPDPPGGWPRVPPRLFVLILVLRCTGYLGVLAGATTLLLRGYPLEVSVAYSTVIAAAGAAVAARLTVGLVPVRRRLR